MDCYDSKYCENGNCNKCKVMESANANAYKKLVYDNPEGNYQMLHNATFIKDKEVYLRLGESNISLVDYCKQQCKEICNIELEGDAETFGDNMDCDCIVSIFYGLATGHAELRANLKEYEDSNLSPEEAKMLKNKEA